MQRYAGIAAGSVPERVIISELAAVGHLIGPRLDLMQAYDIRTVSLQPVAELRLARTDAVDVPGGDLHGCEDTGSVERRNPKASAGLEAKPYHAKEIAMAHYVDG